MEPTSQKDLTQEIELYRNLAENACDLICQTGPTGRYLYVSPNYEQILGYRPEELVGKSVFKLVHPDDLPEVNRRFVMGVITQQPAQIQFRYLHKSGQWRWLETSGKPFFGWKGLWRATFISRDVTERRHMEEQLRHELNFRERVLASTSNAIAALDAEGCLLLANERMQEMSGYTKDELIGRALISLLAPEDQKSMQLLLQEVRKEQQIKSRHEVILIEKGGFERRLVLTLSPLQDDKGSGGVVMTAEDVTLLRHSEQEREHLLDQLEVSQKLEAVGTLTAGVAHDFNNILSSVLMTTQLLQQDVADPAMQKQLLAMQKKAIDRAMALTEQLLGFSRHEKIHVGPVDLLSRINDVLDFCSTQMDKRIAIVKELPENLPPVWGEGRQIDQVLLNLLLNAGQALIPRLENQQPARITLRLAEKSLDEALAKKYGLIPGQRMILLSVEDTGMGIPTSLRTRIFEPFFTTKAARGHHGLGLSTVGVIIKDHHGAMEIESDEGKGTSFHVYLPVSSHGENSSVSASPGSSQTRSTADSSPESKRLTRLAL